MKINYILTFFGLILGLTVFMGNSGGRAAAANQGNTGAPGDNSQTCKSCHNSTSIQVDLTIDLFDQNGNSIAAEGYVPGETYEVRVSLNPLAGSPAGYGFQLMALNGEAGVNAPQATNWSNPGSNVKISTINSTGRVYAEHKGVSSSNLFVLDWTAPAGGGPVTFYACGNGVNGNSGDSGDGAGCNTLTILEQQGSGFAGVNLLSEPLFFPNPVEDALQIELEAKKPVSLIVSVTDLTGKQLVFQKLETQTGRNLFQLNTADWKTGTYWVRLTGKGVDIQSTLLKP